jgi:endoribonuclease Dicer
MLQQGNRFICEVVLPEVSPIVSAIGSLSSRKATAKRSAAFEACVELIKCGVLDKNLLSTYEKRLPVMSNAHLALDERSKAVYERLTKPGLWSLHLYVPSELYLTVFQIDGQEKLSQEYQPIGIMTRTPMPEIPGFPIHIKPDEASSILTTSFKVGLKISEKLLELLTESTARFFSDVFNKTYVEDADRRAYWVVAVKQKVSSLPDTRPEDIIDWDIIKAVAQDKEGFWDKTAHNAHLEGRFFVDPNSGAHRYFSASVTNLRAFDPLPVEEGLKRPHKGDLIIEQCSGLWKRSKGRLTSNADPDQPVLLANMVNLQRNWLDKTLPSGFISKCYICPEPLRISPVSFVPCDLSADLRL